MFGLVCFLFCRYYGPEKSSSIARRQFLELTFVLWILRWSPIWNLNNYTNKLGWLYNRVFSISLTIDWNKLSEIGILKRLHPYLINTSVENGISLTCNGWKNLFSIKEPIFKELCDEFFSTISIEAKIVDPHFTMTSAFHFGGQYRECSFVEFAWRKGLYEKHETMSPIFYRFLRLATWDYS